MSYASGCGPGGHTTNCNCGEGYSLERSSSGGGDVAGVILITIFVIGLLTFWLGGAIAFFTSNDPGGGLLWLVGWPAIFLLT